MANDRFYIATVAMLLKPYVYMDINFSLNGYEIILTTLCVMSNIFYLRENCVVSYEIYRPSLLKYIICL